ncbi:triphosphoribosyl-dephospho-CoA synthase CitG [Rodentibacter myodis]|uniref:Probable 2-(5''-triphosphoribosyl)-3'-dephosphocoenzyme-A synthase n=1 Tax=Rodentibacter myodis TaxID=1907939 RepID=A0A1V3JTM9_9PAST|nr:triphosphoribosyl-dephospho-CoA synthase CitG [Rodentibacter myodis]OOF59781.1 2-(5'-triphosphoribosyl)-3'-dephospho CoA synthase [Rodentibacter myodis]
MQRFFQTFSTQGKGISLEDLLNAREARALLQQRLLAKYRQPLVSVTLTAVGSVKKNPLLDYVFEKALEKLTALFAQRNRLITEKIVRPLDTGHEAFFVLPINADELKQAMIELEDSTPLARLWDLDVFDENGNLLSRAEFGFSPRACLVCGDNAKYCARHRQHQTEEIMAEMQHRAQGHYFAEQIGGLVYQALLQEARLSPKPGLVDALTNGAHTDMNLQTFEQSAVVLKPFFTDFVLKGMETANLPENQILAQLRPIGILAEKAMLLATKNINTHKGAIFSFGLVCAAIGRLSAQAQFKSYAVNLDVTLICRLVAQFAAGLTKELEHYPTHLPITAGVRLFREYGLTGARGEAESGFHQIQTLLPLLDEYHQLAWEHRLLIALLHLMAKNPDTNVVHRGGLEGLQFVQQSAIDLLENQSLVLDKAGLTQALLKFDSDCIEKNLSAGGSADLLALSIFFLLFRGD